jgi:hypothetical protein
MRYGQNLGNKGVVGSSPESRVARVRSFLASGRALTTGDTEGHREIAPFPGALSDYRAHLVFKELFVFLSRPPEKTCRSQETKPPSDPESVEASQTLRLIYYLEERWEFP